MSTAGRTVRITLFRVTLAIKWLTVRDNGYGGIIVTGPLDFRAQRSGHGHWCELRFGRFEWWGCGRTGKHVRAFWRAAAKTGGA